MSVNFRRPVLVSSVPTGPVSERCYRLFEANPELFAKGLTIPMDLVRQFVGDVDRKVVKVYKGRWLQRGNTGVTPGVTEGTQWPDSFGARPRWMDRCYPCYPSGVTPVLPLSPGAMSESGYSRTDISDLGSSSIPSTSSSSVSPANSRGAADEDDVARLSTKTNPTQSTTASETLAWLDQYYATREGATS